ncbi:hypothetical protein U1Q18_012936 [Sarracenia purpurea var. burkii]
MVFEAVKKKINSDNCRKHAFNTKYTHTLRSNSSASDGDLESQGPHRSNKGIRDLLKRLDCGFLGRRLSIKRLDRDHSSSVNHVGGGRGSGVGVGGDDILGNGAPREWALLHIGCLLGLATGLCVVAFNRGEDRSW